MVNAMDWPGEKLLIKLWETLAEKGVGSLLKPWQIRREGLANADVRRYELLALADAERESEEVQSGRRKLNDAQYAISLTKPSSDGELVIEKEKTPMMELANRAVIADALRKEINVAKAVTHAEDELRDDPAQTPDKNLDEDWLYRWRDYAGNVSSEELQAIWGRILAGELKSPGQYSYRLLDFVRNLAKDEASLIEKISPFVLTNFLISQPESLLNDFGITFEELFKLQELGILSGVAAIGLSKSFKSNSHESYIKLLVCYDRGIILKHKDPAKVCELQVYTMTTLGQQVIRLGKFTPDEDYLRAIGRELKKSEFEVSLVNYKDAGNGMAKCSNFKEIID